MKVMEQDVPSDIFFTYKTSLRPSSQWINNLFGTFKFGTRKFGLGSNIYVVQKRNPFRMPHMQGFGGNTPSAKQIGVRRAFMRVINALWQTQRWYDDVDEYGIGPMQRGWWYNDPGRKELGYYNYFQQVNWFHTFANEPKPWIRFHNFKDTYVATGTMGDAQTNYSNEYLLWAGIMVDEYNQINGNAFILINKTHPKYENRLSTMFFSVGFANTGFRVHEVPGNYVDIDNVTYATQPSIGKLLGVYTLEELNETIMPRIIKRDETDPLTESAYDAIAITMEAPYYPEQQVEGFNGVVFRSKENPNANHASICP